jgi:ADP-heptose:LPS heptosyltransferase
MDQLSSTLQHGQVLLLDQAGAAEAVLALPALEAFRASFPQARLVMVTSFAAAPVYLRSGLVTEVWPVARPSRGEWLDLRHGWRTLRTLGRLRKEPIDLLIDWTREGSSGWMRASCRTPAWQLTPEGLRRREEGGSWEVRLSRILTTLGLAPGSPPLPHPLHRTHQLLQCLEPLGVRPTTRRPRLQTEPRMDERIAIRLEKRGRPRQAMARGLLVGLVAEQEVGSASWSEERAIRLATRIIHNFGDFGVRILFLHDGSGQATVRRMERALRQEVPQAHVVSLPSLSWEENLSVLASLSIVAAPLGPIAHLAAALDTPVVAVTHEALAGPLDLLGPHVLHVRPRQGAPVDEEAIYDGICHLLRINRSELLSQR